MWKSLITIRRSSRARCSPRASPAAIATTPIARSFELPETVSACNVMPPTNTPSVKHRHHAGADPPPACISCHMQARIYMVVDPRHDHRFRVPQARSFRQAWDTRTLATAATATSRRNGPPTPSKAGSGLTARAFRPMRRHSMPHARTRPMQPRFLSPLPRMEMRQAVARASALSRARLSRLAREYRGSAKRACRSRSDGADRGSRHAGKRAGRSDLAVGISASRRSRARRPHQGSLAARGSSDREPACRRIASVSIGRQRSLSPRNAPTPRGRKPAPRSGIFSRSADWPPTPRLNTRLHCGSARNTRRRPSIWLTFIGNSAGTARAKVFCALRSPFLRARRPRITRSAWR